MKKRSYSEPKAEFMTLQADDIICSSDSFDSDDEKDVDAGDFD